MTCRLPDEGALGGRDLGYLLSLRQGCAACLPLPSPGLVFLAVSEAGVGSVLGPF